jgi:Na+:H+ antiporter, NhaA family
LSATPSHAPRGFFRLRGLRDDFAAFMQLETAGAMVLLAATVVALVLANTDAFAGLERILHAEIGISIGSWHFEQSFKHWIDDGLMALFFFVIGLEVKREIVVGELSKPRQAILPIVAAVGGMLAPALIYLSLNSRGPGAHGWGIPMATDIAFALGALSALGSRHAPAKLRLFLTTLAIADDIGAIIVIAVFYTRGVAYQWLLVAAVLVAALWLLNGSGVDSTAPYAVLGVLVWFAFLNSGVHATIAGVLVALTIPTRSQLEPLEYCEFAHAKLDEIEQVHDPNAHVLEDDAQQKAAFEIRDVSQGIASPLQRMEHVLHPITTFVVLPLFALANADIRLVGLDVPHLLTQPVVLGVFFGLLVGKPLGITAFTWLCVRLGLADLPRGVSWRQILGGAILAGIGFTMSLFIATLAFKDPLLLSEAKLAVLLTSVVAGACGYIFLRFVSGTGDVAVDALSDDLAVSSNRRTSR